MDDCSLGGYALDRRQFLGLGIVACTAVGAAWVTQREIPRLIRYIESIPRQVVITSPTDSEKGVLEDFLTGSKTHTKEDIESRLYNVVAKVQGGFGIGVGKALDIGAGLALTAYHVVDPRTSREGVEALELIRLDERFRRGQPYQSFQLVAYAADSDLALLRTQVAENGNTAHIHLAPTVAPVGHPISVVKEVRGELYFEPIKTNYEHRFVGKDEQGRPLDLGKLVLKAGSRFYEHEGRVLEYDINLVRQLTRQDPANARPLSRNVAQFGQLFLYEGDSGSPIFLKVDEDKFFLVGVTSQVMKFLSKIDIPNDMLGYNGRPQTGTIFSDRNVIEKLVKAYQSSKN